MTGDEQMSGKVRSHIAALESAHGDLDAQAEHMSRKPGVSSLEIRDVKKQKLAIKDRIATFWRQARRK